MSERLPSKSLQPIRSDEKTPHRSMRFLNPTGIRVIGFRGNGTFESLFGLSAGELKSRMKPAAAMPGEVLRGRCRNGQYFACA